MRLLHVLSTRAGTVGSSAPFLAFLTFNAVLYAVFTVLWKRIGLPNCELPKDVQAPTWSLAAYTSVVTHLSFSCPGDVVPRSQRARALTACHASLSWLGLFLLATAWM